MKQDNWILEKLESNAPNGYYLIISRLIYMNNISGSREIKVGKHMGFVEIVIGKTNTHFFGMFNSGTIV